MAVQPPAACQIEQAPLTGHGRAEFFALRPIAAKAHRSMVAEPQAV